MPAEPLNLEEEFALWPENESIFNFWLTVQTQWRVSFVNGKRTGMEYSGILACMEMQCIPRKKRPELFKAVQIMEAAVLEALR